MSRRIRFGLPQSTSMIMIHRKQRRIRPIKSSGEPTRMYHEVVAKVTKLHAAKLSSNLHRLSLWKTPKNINGRVMPDQIFLMSSIPTWMNDQISKWKRRFVLTRGSLCALCITSRNSLLQLHKIIGLRYMLFSIGASFICNDSHNYSIRQGNKEILEI